MNTSVKRSRLQYPEYWMVLSAIALMSVFYYGIRAAAVMGLAAVTAVLTDFICLFLRSRSFGASDLSGAADAVIMVMLFPATIPYSIVILSTVFAVAVGTHAFGSRGDRLFPPPAIGYLFALICWKYEVLAFPQAGENLALFGNEDVVLHDSLSHSLNTEGLLRTDTLDLLLGAVPTAMGTGCLLLLFVGLAVLLFRGGVSYSACLGYALGLSVFAVFGNQPVWQYFASNMVLFSMLFLLTDSASEVDNGPAVWVSGALAGALTYYLIAVHGIEYAPLIAILLIRPAERALAAGETYLADKLQKQAAAVQEESVVTANDENE